MYVALGADVEWLGPPHSLVKSVQQETNVALKRLGCHQIGTDGKLGPETCGAIDYVMTRGEHSAAAVAQAQWLMGICKRASYSCKASGGGGAALPYEPATASAASPLSSSNLIVGAVVVATVGIVGYAIAKKKGMVK